MAHKLIRNTIPATKQASLNKRQKQEDIRDLIRTHIFKERCTCGRCINGDYSDLCFYFSGLAKLANDYQISSVTGITGKWKTNQIIRLFPDSNSRHNNSPSQKAKMVRDQLINGGKTSLDGLI